MPGARDVALTARYAYVSAGFNGLRVVDISDNTRPVEVGYYDTPGSAQKVTVQGDLVYVADGDGGVYILRHQPPVQFVIGVEGGSFTSQFDRTTYTFASATFSEAVTISHALRLPGETALPQPLVGINHFFENSAISQVSKQQVSPAKPYTITVHYTDAEKGSAIEETLALYLWKEGQWVWEQSSVVNSSANTVTAQPSSFGWWAALGETNRTYLPILGQ